MPEAVVGEQSIGMQQDVRVSSLVGQRDGEGDSIRWNPYISQASRHRPSGEYVRSRPPLVGQPFGRQLCNSRCGKIVEGQTSVERQSRWVGSASASGREQRGSAPIPPLEQKVI